MQQNGTSVAKPFSFAKDDVSSDDDSQWLNVLVPGATMQKINEN